MPPPPAVPRLRDSKPERFGGSDDHRFDILQLSLTTAVLALVLAIRFVVLYLAAPIARLIGDAGINIMSRVMGMILVALAVHTVLSALGAWLNLPAL